MIGTVSVALSSDGRYRRRAGHAGVFARRFGVCESAMDAKSRVDDSVPQAIFSHPDNGPGNSTPRSITCGVFPKTHLLFFLCGTLATPWTMN